MNLKYLIDNFKVLNKKMSSLGAKLKLKLEAHKMFILKS